MKTESAAENLPFYIVEQKQLCRQDWDSAAESVTSESKVRLLPILPLVLLSVLVQSRRIQANHQRYFVI